MIRWRPPRPDPARVLPMAQTIEEVAGDLDEWPGYPPTERIRVAGIECCDEHYMTGFTVEEWREAPGEVGTRGAREHLEAKCRSGSLHQ